MKIRNIVTGEILDAEWRTDHAASSYGQPALVLTKTGEAVDAIWYKILEGESGEVKR